MPDDAAEPPGSDFLYLTTTGWRSGRPHRIEIWYVLVDGRYYLCAETGERAHWVRNLRRQSALQFEVTGRHFAGRGRVVGPDEPELLRGVRAAFDQRYGWSSGLIVELEPVRAEV